MQGKSVPQADHGDLALLTEWDLDMDAPGQPRESALAQLLKNAGVASGKGLWSRDPSAISEIPFIALKTAALTVKTRLRPGR